MDTNKKQTGLLYLEKNKITLYTMSGKPMVISLSKEVMSHLEIVDKSKFEQIVANFITKNNLSPMTLFIILSKEVVFEKTFESMALSLQATESEKFLEMVPFHNILSNTFTFSKKTIVTAANRATIEIIIQVFKDNFFPSAGCLSITLAEEKYPKLLEEFDAKLLIKKIETLRQYFLPLELSHTEGILSYNVPSFKNLQFIALISVFVLLLVILGIQVYTQVINPAKTQPKTPVVVQKEVPTLPPTITATPSATIAPTVFYTYPTLTPAATQ